MSFAAISYTHIKVVSSARIADTILAPIAVYPSLREFLYLRQFFYPLFYFLVYSFLTSESINLIYDSLVSRRLF